MADTLFAKIIDRQIPADIVYEDDLCLAFRDVNPQAPVHVLLVPKKPLDMLSNAGAEDRRYWVTCCSPPVRSRASSKSTALSGS